MIALQIFDVFNLESVKEKVIQPQHGNGILKAESQHEPPQEVIGPLDSSPVLCLIALPNINSFLLHVHPDLQLHVLNNSLANLLPVVFEGSHAIGRDQH